MEWKQTDGQTDATDGFAFPATKMVGKYWSLYHISTAPERHRGPVLREDQQSLW